MHRLPRALTLRQTPHAIHRPQPIRRAQIPRIQRRHKSQTVYSSSSGEPINLRTVRFKRPGFFTFRRLATVGVYTGVVYLYFNLLWRYMDIEIEFVDDEEEQTDEQKQASGDPSKEEASEEEDGPPFYADPDSTFIPMTWSKKLPRTYYRGSDPEWQEFIKIAQDRTRHKKIQSELVQIVYTGSTQHPTIARQLGPEAKVGKYWLDISFPDGPPPEYERSGIEIGDGFVAWSQQIVSQEKQWRLMRALWPSAAAQSSWATLKVLAGIQWRRVKQSLGLEARDPMAPEERFKTAMEMVEKRQAAAREGKQGGVGKAQTDPSGSPGAVASSRDAASSPSATPSPQARPSSSSSSDGKKFPIPLPNLPLPSAPASASSAASTDLPIAMHVFQSTLSKTWSPTAKANRQGGVAPFDPPRGSFVVQGLVEVRGQRGRMLFDVQSAYDPSQGKFVQVNAGVRGYKRWRQGPKGGP
ncbi:uncharacterized protein LTR77_003853 [Saxophila tyrrhenica]|uniref:Mitochondrial import inner membrane translocase subunit TIM54 n=1 Tax=Saxophila tyrrhenica TaxID=1690608 RepID=A0AAV9PEU5_9PEZI|nr:hypothetical protein LTR77_003853 [Saxophila tyrrhenica]